RVTPPSFAQSTTLDRAHRAFASWSCRLAENVRTHAGGTQAESPPLYRLQRFAVCRHGASLRWILPPPFGVNLTAFESRFHVICCSRSGSAAITPAPSNEVRRVTPLASAAGRTVSSALATRLATSTSLGVIRTFPVIILETSRMSLIS